MMYNLLTVEPLPLDTVTAALARCLHVREQEVDAADEATDQELRNWDALVFCDKHAIRGDVSDSLDIYVQESVQPQPSERQVASAFAREAGTVVLFPAEDVRPSAYWLATADGLVTRARLYESDDEQPRYTVDRVESPVAGLPHATVACIPEVVRELKIATPLRDVFAAHLDRMCPEETDGPGTPGWTATTSLGAWEKLVRHIEAAWAPSGWCPPDMYAERLQARDDLEQVKGQLPQAVVPLLENALGPLDSLFARLTVEDTDQVCRDLARVENIEPGSGWWWDRRPDPLPW